MNLNLQNVFQEFLFLTLKVDCVGCGSLIPGQMGLCQLCEKDIDQYLVQSELKIEPHVYRSIYHWIPQESDQLSNLVYMLKSTHAKTAWGQLAKKFIEVNDVEHKINRIYLPIPSRRQKKHSFYFAQALAKNLKGEVIMVLKVAENEVQTEQKKQNKISRAMVKFELNELFTCQFKARLQEADEIILVDDVITTGSTYKSVYSLIEQYANPKSKIELWTALTRDHL